MKKIIWVAAVALVVSCTNEGAISDAQLGGGRVLNESMTTADYEVSPESRAALPQESKGKELSKVIKNGSLNFKVSSLTDSKKKVDQLITKNEGYYANEQYNAYGNTNTFSLQVRVPSEKFETLIRELEGDVGGLIAKNISATDVTEEYIDLDIRLANNLAYLAQYQEVLKKAISIKEILEVKEEIRRLEEEIESKKARMKYIDSNVEYATLYIELTETISRPLNNGSSFGRRIVNSFYSGIESFLGLIVAVISIWPILILMTLLLVFRKRLLAFLRAK